MQLKTTVGVIDLQWENEMRECCSQYPGRLDLNRSNEMTLARMRGYQENNGGCSSAEKKQWKQGAGTREEGCGT